jgi:hypothetical protein
MYMALGKTLADCIPRLKQKNCDILTLLDCFDVIATRSVSHNGRSFLVPKHYVRTQFEFCLAYISVKQSLTLAVSNFFLIESGLGISAVKAWLYFPTAGHFLMAVR